ncbi:MAG TPA: hypothetical protein VF493_01370 [Terriglobales bacterium]
MGSSFVEYRGRGFWSRDAYLEDALAFLAQAIGDSPEEAWLSELRDHWRLQSSGDFNGWIHPNLDEYLTSDERRTAVLKLVDNIALRPDLTEEAKQTLALLIALLNGELSIDASSPLDYMVKRVPFPYKKSGP